MDNNFVKKVLTFKSGEFIFSREYDPLRVLYPLAKASTLCETINDLPILPHLATKLEEELIVKSIFGTAAIEGNPLKEDQVAEVLSNTRAPGKLQKTEREIQNLKAAYDWIFELKGYDPKFKLNENIVKKIHSIVTFDIPHEHNILGKYRNNKVQVGDADHGGIYTPPKILKDIETLMGEYISFINSKTPIKKHPIIHAALAHCYLGLIHPFGDGNGRTARLIEAMFLRLAGIKYVPIMLSNFYYRNKDEYFWAFSNAKKNKRNDVTPFIEFVLKGIIESSTEIKEGMTYFIRRFTLRDYYSYLRNEKRMTQRQHDFLIILLEGVGVFKLKDLFTEPLLKTLYRSVSERTARRDISKLVKDKLLISRGAEYELNYKALESTLA